MYFQYTGQPGHGKTVLAIEFALDMKERADKLHLEDPAKHPLRELYVCNVRDFNHGACGAIDLSPDEVKSWHSDPKFDHAIILIDEAYEHGMFPRRAPGRPVPEHVQQVAKHRHRGIDFVMICQSPKKQMDDFLHDLIEEHYHIRRRYGLPFVHIKRWDKFEPNPDKAESLTTKRRSYPKRIFKLYTSTKYDTSEKRIPWFYWAALGLVIALAFVGPYAWSRISGRVGGGSTPPAAMQGPQADGALAKAAKRGPESQAKSRGTTDDYVASLMPRVPGQPWSAPIYDGLSVPADPPRLFCMATGAGRDGHDEIREASCSCITEQGTRYTMAFADCSAIARSGQYEPYLRRRADTPQSGQERTITARDDRGTQPDSAFSSSTGGAVIQVGNRPIGTFPESAQHRYGGS